MSLWGEILYDIEFERKAYSVFEYIGLAFSQLLGDYFLPHEDVGLFKGVAFSDMQPLLLVSVRNIDYAKVSISATTAYLYLAFSDIYLLSVRSK